MEKIKEIIARYLPFLWWVFLAFLTICGCVCCAVQAACGFGKFFAICGSIGSGIATLIFIWQAYCEWLERNNY